MGTEHRALAVRVAGHEWVEPVGMFATSYSCGHRAFCLGPERYCPVCGALVVGRLDALPTDCQWACTDEEVEFVYPGSSRGASGGAPGARAGDNA